MFVLEQPKADVKSTTVLECFLCRRLGIFVSGLGVLEQTVGGSDDVLDLRTCLRFQGRNAVDQHRLIGNLIACAFERREFLMGSDKGF